MTTHPKTSPLRAVEAELPQGEVQARETVQASAEPAAVTKRRKLSVRSFIFPIILLGLISAGGWFGYNYWIEGRFMVSTDDAYVSADIANISPKVSGYVQSVVAKANQPVKKGDVLATLDDGDYKLAVQLAEAQLASVRLSLDRIDAQIAGARATRQQADAQLAATEAGLKGAEIAQRRATDLNAKDVGTTAALDAANVALAQAQANRAGSTANIAAADANIALLNAQRKEVESNLKSLELSLAKANRDLSFTVLRAPYDGILGNIAIKEGDLVSPGQRLGALVPIEDLYVDANFKETQLKSIRPGQKVAVHVDAYSTQTVEGTVQSIAPASGAVFSMLPPENATGNFTKVIQRVPVRITLPKDVLEKGILRAGFSVVVDIDTRTGPANQ